MKSFIKKFLCGAAAFSVLAVSTVSAFPATLNFTVASAADPIFSAEAEDCEILSGSSVTTNVYGTEYPGYSGSGFVWAANSGGVKFEVTLTEGAMYELTTSCWMYLGNQGETRMQNLAIDGVTEGSFYIPNNGTWSDFSFGYFYLEAGTHTIEIGASGSWGFVLYDTVTFDYADMPEHNLSDATCDPDATPETKALMSYMTSIYGKQIMSGQQEIYGGGNNGDTELEFEYIYEKTGKYPVIRGFDLMNYNPLYGWEDGTTGRIIQWVAQRGGIATASWHINVPQDFTSYELGETLDWTDCTYKPTSSFNTANCLDSSTKEYAYLMLAIEDLAEQLLILQEANVPLILRPFHEAEGNNNTDGSGAWFWWGSAGADVYRELWKLLYTTLTEEYGIHNCIWEVNLYSYANSYQWYPGDEYVDMVAYDKYEGSPYTWGEEAATTVFLTLVDYTNDTKMVALSENDKIPAIDNMVNEGAWWSYFCPWYGNFITDGVYNTVELLDEVYNSEYVLTLDEIPNDIYGYERGNGGNFDVEGAYECEDGSIVAHQGTQTISSSLCSGGGYVFLKEASDSITQTVNVDKAGYYALSYGYQQQYEPNGKTQNLVVNGGEAVEAFFPYSIIFGESDPIYVQLNAGTNTIKLEAVEGWAYYDYLLVEYYGDSAPTESEEPEEPEEPAGIIGDANGDGKVNAMDATLVARHAVGSLQLSDEAKALTDVNGDGKINAMDATLIARFAIGNLEKFPIEA